MERSSAGLLLGGCGGAPPALLLVLLPSALVADMRACRCAEQMAAAAAVQCHGDCQIDEEQNMP
jgi:hypothetical protein